MILVLALLGVRLTKLMIGDSEYYASLAQDLHERERTIKAQRGRILDPKRGRAGRQPHGLYHLGDSQSDRGCGRSDESSCRELETGRDSGTEKGGESFLYGN